MTPRTSFDLPPELVAAAPPEARGVERDSIRLLVAEGDSIEHARFRDIGDHLRPGDLVVVNISATIPAAIDAMRGQIDPVVVHLSSLLDDGSWVVEVRADDGSTRVEDLRAGETLSLPAGFTLTLVAAYPDPCIQGDSRLWRARIAIEGGVARYLARFGRPITYGYVRGRWSLDHYQTVFARVPGSAEMPSAGRPFTHRLVTDLVTRGIVLAPILLHSAVSSLDVDEPPVPERFRVPASTAHLVAHTKQTGGRVIAVGTTVTRALESTARPDGSVEAAEGWTDLVLSPDRPARVVDGLVTGWHPPDASHLLLLEAVAEPELVQSAYREALARRYRWHEFGDSCLLLTTQ